MDKGNKEVKNFSYVMGCLFRLNLVVDEMEILYQERPDIKERIFISHNMFKIYHMGLKYIFILEYCKLLEGDDKQKDNHLASLAKLNEKIKKVNIKYKNYEIVKAKIEALYESEFHKKNIRELRDSTYAHLDKHGDTYSVKGFNEDEFTTAKSHVKEMIEILNLCGSSHSGQYLIERDYDYAETLISQYAQFTETRDEKVNRILSELRTPKNK